MESFQHRVDAWMQECFGAEVSSDRVERFFRFLEEALELAQAMGCTEKEARALVAYVFGRPAGEPAQEVGGVMVTLAALVNAAELPDIEACAWSEISRCEGKIDRIRAKHAAKPKGIRTALPGDAP